MSDLAIAFQKAGLPTASVAFAAACHDLARLALNRQPDPERAVAVALGMMSGKAEFRAALKQFLAEVASERPGKAKSDGEAQTIHGAQAPIQVVARLSDPKGDAVDLIDNGAASAHPTVVPASPPLSDGADQVGLGSDVHPGYVPPSEPQGDAEDRRGSGASVAPGGSVPASSVSSGGVDQTSCGANVAQRSPVPPSETRLRAMAKSREETVRAVSKFGFFITERQGSRTPIEHIEVSRLESLCTMTGRRTMASMVENFTLRALLRRMPAFSPNGSRLEDVFSAPEITDAIESARLSVADMLAMPKERQLEARA